MEKSITIFKTKLKRKNDTYFLKPVSQIAFIQDY